MASADPENQNGPRRICAGTGVTYCPSNVENRHVWLTCRSRLWLLYCVSTTIFSSPALAKFDKAKSISR
jgi:hypothetical protein